MTTPRIHSRRRLARGAIGSTGACLLAALLLAAPAAARGAPAAPSLEDRVAVLEKRLAELSAENASLRDAQSAKAAPAAKPEKKAESAPVVTITGKASKLSIGGLLQVHGETGGVPDSRFAGMYDRFQLRRLRTSVAGAFTENVTFKVEADFGNAGIGGNTGARGQLTDAFAIWSEKPGLRLQAGQFKTPFGYEQLLADPKTLFVERTLSNDRLTVGRQIGLMAAGDLPGSALSYAYGIFNGNGVNNGNNDSDQFMHAGRVAGTINLSADKDRPVRLILGTNFFGSSDKGSFTGHRTGYGLNAVVAAKSLEVGAEWLRNDYAPAAGTGYRSAGWYCYGAYLFNPRWQGVARLDEYDTNTRLGDTTTREWTWGVNYFLKGDDLKLSLDYILGYPPGTQGSDGRLIGRVQVVF